MAKDKPLTNRQKLFVDYLPAYNWNYTKAAIAAGYKETYANDRIHSLVKKSIGLSRSIETKRQELTAKTESYREKRLKEIRYRMDNLPKTGKTTEFCKLADLEANICGWKSTTTNVNLETDRRQARLDALQKAEVSRLLNEDLGIVPMLPPRPIYSDVYDSQQDTKTDNNEVIQPLATTESSPESPEEGP